MRFRWWMALAAAVAAYLAVMGCVIFPSSESPGSSAAPGSAETGAGQQVHVLTPLTGLPYRGMAMQVQRIDDVMDYGRSVDMIAELGCDTILLVVDSKQENGKSTHIFLDMRDEPAPDKLGELIQYAHKRKLRVILMPIVLLADPINNEWRGKIQPELWEHWWESYRQMLRHYDRVAEQNHVEMFVVGSELVSTEEYLEQWTLTIRQVRSEYHGQLTYSANWDHYDSIPFWDQLDLMAMNSYYKLGKSNRATVAEIRQRWAGIQNDILKFGRKINKPVLMMEVGWCSVANAVTDPWDYTQESVPLDLDVQKRLYEAYFESWYGKKGFAGFMIWAWAPNAGGLDDRGYTPAGKPAEQVLRKWLAKGPWQVQ